MNIGYLIYEVERPKSVSEQRAADIQAGELAADAARLGRLLKSAVMRVAQLTRAGRAPELTVEAVADGGVSVADLERLYEAPCARPAHDSHGADGERTVRSA